MAALINVSCSTIRRWEASARPSRITSMAYAILLDYDPIQFASAVELVADTGCLPHFAGEPISHSNYEPSDPELDAQTAIGDHL